MVIFGAARGTVSALVITMAALGARRLTAAAMVVLLIVVLTAAFAGATLVFLRPGMSLVAWQQPASTSPVGQPQTGAAQPLTEAESRHVLSYVEGHRTDDPLVEVRPGVYAKRSNVQGVEVNGRTVYYDLAGHQSFGPWRSGKVKESEVEILARAGEPPFTVIMYALKR
ncbi:MAG: hypothetical protein HY332_09945 [Chloroflexi bacterium]|nr:hypothetical protein [Chloroflexota bacterium]